MIETNVFQFTQPFSRRTTRLILDGGPGRLLPTCFARARSDGAPRLWRLAAHHAGYVRHRHLPAAGAHPARTGLARLPPGPATR